LVKKRFNSALYLQKDAMMTKAELNNLHNLSREEKIELVQLLWDDIATSQLSNEISDDHRRKLEQTLNNIKAGKTEFRNWTEAKAKYFTRK